MPSAGAACSAPAPTSSRPRRASHAASRSIRRAAASTSTSGSTARSSRRATPGRSPPPASSGSASAPTSRATTSRSRRARSPPGSASRPSVTRATGSRTSCARPPRTACSRRRLGRTLLPALGRGDPHRLLLRHRLRPRAARGARGRAQPRGGAQCLRRVLAPPRPRVRVGVRAPARDPRAAAAHCSPACSRWSAAAASATARSPGTCARRTRPSPRERPGHREWRDCGRPTAPSRPCAGRPRGGRRGLRVPGPQRRRQDDDVEILEGFRERGAGEWSCSAPTRPRPGARGVSAIGVVLQGSR